MWELASNGKVALVRALDSAVLLGRGRQTLMIDEMADGHQLRQLYNPAIVIGVKMSDEQIVDLLDTGMSSRGNDTIRVAGFGWITGRRIRYSATSPPRIDEERLPLRSHEQGGLAALNIDEIDVECSGRRAVGGSQRQERNGR